MVTKPTIHHHFLCETPVLYIKRMFPPQKPTHSNSVRLCEGIMRQGQTVRPLCRDQNLLYTTTYPERLDENECSMCHILKPAFFSFSFWTFFKRLPCHTHTHAHPYNPALSHSLGWGLSQWHHAAIQQAAPSACCHDNPTSSCSVSSPGGHVHKYFCVRMR